MMNKAYRVWKLEDAALITKQGQGFSLEKLTWTRNSLKKITATREATALTTGKQGKQKLGAVFTLTERKTAFIDPIPTDTYS
uniref:Paeninodin family lasso peptide n=1 Tax=Caenorhabditis tropicalis TaxID=1561998 RepID=A0A1I7UGF2_9PELO